MIRSCAKKAVAEGLQRRFLTGRSSGIGVREDCWASATLQHIAAHRTRLGAPDMGKRRIVQHTSGGTHCHGGGRRECPRQMRRERRSALCTLPWLLHADKARRLSIFNITGAESLRRHQLLWRRGQRSPREQRRTRCVPRPGTRARASTSCTAPWGCSRRCCSRAQRFHGCNLAPPLFLGPSPDGAAWQLDAGIVAGLFDRWYFPRSSLR